MIDPRYFETEQSIRGWIDLFPVWLAQTKSLNPNSYSVPPHFQSVSVIKDNGIRCLGNVCAHKQSIILDGEGRLGPTITCPIHKWAWNKEGVIRSARGIESFTNNMCLPTYQLTEWQGHLFTGKNTWLNDINKLEEVLPYLDISGYVKHSHHSINYDFDWKIFYEIFLDLYHVQTFHPGLRGLTDCKTFDWKFGNDWGCQTALFNKASPTEKNYHELQAIYRRTGHYETAKYGAVWLGIYPNIMLEQYPGCFVVSTVWPNGAGKCTNHLDFYYEEGLLEKEPAFAEVQQRSFMATAKEDETIGLRIAKGRSMLSDPIQFINHPIEEAGTEHFYNWLKSNTKFLTG